MIITHMDKQPRFNICWSITAFLTNSSWWPSRGECDLLYPPGPLCWHSHILQKLGTLMPTYLRIPLLLREKTALIATVLTSPSSKPDPCFTSSMKLFPNSSALCYFPFSDFLPHAILHSLALDCVLLWNFFYYYILLMLFAYLAILQTLLN